MGPCSHSTDQETHSGKSLRICVVYTYVYVGVRAKPRGGHQVSVCSVIALFNPFRQVLSLNMELDGQLALVTLLSPGNPPVS